MIEKRNAMRIIASDSTDSVFISNSETEDGSVFQDTIPDPSFTSDTEDIDSPYPARD